MTTNLNKVLKHIHHLLAPPGGELTDGELLARFVATRDETSFAALVRRHGPMVLAVCRRMLRHHQDAEDCFQATFMVLARKAATVKREAVGSWLYAVAYRTSLEARAVNARRRTRERQVLEMPQPEVMPLEVPDWRPWLDRELNRLPEQYRAVIVACDLEGRSRKEAARQLGIAEGTLSSRLARGRSLLAKRLAPHGLSLSGAALAAALCQSAASAQVPAVLFSTTTKAALLAAAGEFAAVSASSAILMKGVLKSMFLTKLKLTIGAMMMVTALGASGLMYRATGQQASPLAKPSDGKPKSELERLRHENELLKLNLEVVLEKVRAQETELRSLKTQHAPVAISGVLRPDGKSTATVKMWMVEEPKVVRKVEETARALVVPLETQVAPMQDLEIRVVPNLKVLEDKVAPVQDLRIHKVPDQKPRNKEELNQAIDALDKALKGLREQLKKDAAPQKNKTKQSSQSDQPGWRKYEQQYTALSDQLQKLQSDSAMLKEKAGWSERMSRPGLHYLTISQAEADQERLRNARFAEAEAALKLLRETRDPQDQKRATDVIYKVLLELVVQEKSPERGKR